MTMRAIAATAATLAIWVSVSIGASERGQAPAAANGKKESVVTRRASGAFDVKMTPQAFSAEGTALGRMSLDKQFHGDLAGSSKGEMLTAGSPASGSAVYVAVEQVSGTLHGRTGSFMLHHTGIMSRGAQQLTISVVPDSGTGELAGLTGTMTIDVTGGKHAYAFEYAITPGH